MNQFKNSNDFRFPTFHALEHLNNLDKPKKTAYAQEKDWLSQRLQASWQKLPDNDEQAVLSCKTVADLISLAEKKGWTHLMFQNEKGETTIIDFSDKNNVPMICKENGFRNLIDRDLARLNLHASIHYLSDVNEFNSWSKKDLKDLLENLNDSQNFLSQRLAKLGSKLQKSNESAHVSSNENTSSNYNISRGRTREKLIAAENNLQSLFDKNKEQLNKITKLLNGQLASFGNKKE